METNDTQRVSRRDFLGWAIKGGFLATFAMMILPALEYVLPVIRRGPSVGMKEAGNLEDIPVWGAKKVVLEGSALILVRTPDTVKAFSAICTHLGCLVDWDFQKHEFLCPCHAGQFDLEGRVIGGPPPRPLSVRVAKVVDGKIMVEI